MSRSSLKETLRLLSREWRSLLAPFAFDMALGLFFIGVPLLAGARFGADESDMGRLASVCMVTYMIFTPIVGRMNDRGWTRQVLLTGPALVLLSALCVIFSTSLWHVCLGACIFQSASATVWPSLVTSLSQASPSRAMRRLTVFSIAWVIGLALGNQIGGSLRELSVSLPFIACACTVLALVPILIYTEKHHRKPEQLQRQGEEEDETEGIATPIRLRYFRWMAWVALFASVGCICVVRRLFPVRAEAMGFSGTQVGLIGLSCGVWNAVGCFIFGGYPKRWFCRVTPLIGALACQGVGLVILGCVALRIFEHLALALLGAGLNGFGLSLTYLAGIRYSVIGAKNRGTNSGINESVQGAGAVLVPFLAGESVRLFDGGPYFVAAAFVMPVIAFQIFLFSRMRAEERRAHAGQVVS